MVIVFVVIFPIPGFAHARLCLGTQVLSGYSWAEWSQDDIWNQLLRTWDDVVGGGKTKFDSTYEDEAQRVTSALIAVMLSVFGTLVLLNMLIGALYLYLSARSNMSQLFVIASCLYAAIMSDSFERIQEDVELVRLREQVNILLAVRPISFYRADYDYSARPYFFVSTLGKVDGHASTHAGFLGEMKRTMNGRCDQLQEEARETTKHLETSLRKLEAKMDTLLELQHAAAAAAAVHPVDKDKDV